MNFKNKIKWGFKYLNWHNVAKKINEEEAKYSIKGGGYGQNQNKNKYFENIKIQCYNYEKHIHFENECWYKKEKGNTIQKGDEYAIIAHDDCECDALLLMAAQLMKEIYWVRNGILTHGDQTT